MFVGEKLSTPHHIRLLTLPKQVTTYQLDLSVPVKTLAHSVYGSDTLTAHGQVSSRSSLPLAGRSVHSDSLSSNDCVSLESR